MRFKRLGTFCFSGFASFTIFSAVQTLPLASEALAGDPDVVRQATSDEGNFLQEERGEGEEVSSLEAILDAEIFENQQMEDSAELLKSERIEEEIAMEIASEIDDDGQNDSQNDASEEVSEKSSETAFIPSNGLTNSLPSNGLTNSLMKNPSGAEAAPMEQNVQLALSSPMFKSVEGEAPLAAPVRWAKQVVREMESNVHDYSCVLSKRERVNGILGKPELMFVKLRHEPFSVYLKFEKPRKLNGREVVYVENENDGKLLAHGVGLEAMVGTMAVEPDSRLAMKGNRYPITHLGILNLAKLLALLAEKNIHEDCISTRYFDATIDGKKCVCVEVVNSNPKINFQFHKIQVFVDMELNLPIKFVSWGWGSNGETPLLEEYSYSNIKLNCGFTDRDFDVRNPEYEFRESQK